ncbi:Uu.00g035020.m01.CDS01 [Anthostomella pinea]|uniref:Uu.00g035020.m01.CDS01 n=1 Tax=Anthostomella pinea TaxID=933095 RepID=A0AAI8V913_9PEZI|nr:Uu.00g035020.m01.CDS01 [Anthostomella pinea]
MTRHKDIQTAIVGAGLIGPRHASAIQNVPGANVLCIIDPNPATKKVADEFNALYFPSIAAFKQSDYKADAALVCTPNHTHIPVANELLDLKIPLLVEKPFCVEIPPAQALVKRAEGQQTPILVGHHRRFNPYVTTARNVLDSGKIGKVVAIQGSWTTLKPPKYFDPPAEWRRTKGSGGPIRINFVHEVDMLRFLFGNIVRVAAEGGPVTRESHGVEESCAILLRFQSGVVGTFVLSDAVASGHNFESGTGENPMVPMSGSEFLRVYGTRGTLSVPSASVVRFSEPPAGKETGWECPMQYEKPETLPGVDAVPFEEQIKHFIRVVHGEEQPSCTAADGLAAVRVCEAVSLAMERGSWVDVA